jgi:hypothetical protein
MSLIRYLTLKSVSSLNNPQNSETKICENMKLKCLKIILIIIGYSLNNFTTSITIFILDDENKIKSEIHFVNVETLKFDKSVTSS